MHLQLTVFYKCVKFQDGTIISAQDITISIKPKNNVSKRGNNYAMEQARVMVLVCA